MKNIQDIQNIEKADKISFRKLGWITRTNWLWLIGIMLATNILAYLYIRYTKPVFQASSEIKIDIESDASEFGIGSFIEDKNMGVLSGEIELLKSRLFFQKLLDSLDLTVSYYTQGRVLRDEKYPVSPFTISYILKDNSWLDTEVKLDFISDSEFTYQVGERKSDPHKVGKVIVEDGIEFAVKINQPEFDVKSEELVFIINSSESLQNYLDQNLNVQFLNLKANTIQISFQDQNALKARDIVNTINNIYIGYTQQERSRANRNKIEWINDQLGKIEEELEGFETYFEDFTIENRTNNLDEDLKVTVQSINQLDSQQYELKQRIDLASGLLLELDSNRILTPSRILPSEIREAVINLNNLYLQRQQLGISYKETTFTIQSKDKEIESIREAAGQLLVEYRKSLIEAQNELNIRRGKLENAFTQIPGKNTEFNKNQRFYNLYEEFYLSLMQSKAEFEIAVAGITPNFKILEPAKINQNPVSPNRLVIQGSGVTSGFLLCFILIGFRYITEDKINSLDELEEIIPYPNIGNVPKARNSHNGDNLVVMNQPKSGVSEALRSIRTNIQFFVRNKNNQIITVTSSISGEGKTFIAANLASIQAYSGKKVVILDLDMRKPSVHNRFGIDNDKGGVSTVLIGQNKLSEVIRRTEVVNLDFIPAGPIPPNPSELLMDEGFKKLIEELKEFYEVIFMDTPPIGLVTDGILTINHSDLTLLISRHGYTRKRDLLSSLRNLSMIETNISTIYNGYESKGSYGYKYGYYTDKE